MSSRAERIADQAFFSQCFVFQNVVFAELPVSVNLAHRLVLDRSENTLVCSCALQPKPCVHAQAFEMLVRRGGYWFIGNGGCSARLGKDTPKWSGSYFIDP